MQRMRGAEICNCLSAGNPWAGGIHKGACGSVFRAGGAMHGDVPLMAGARYAWVGVYRFGWRRHAKLHRARSAPQGESRPAQQSEYSNAWREQGREARPPDRSAVQQSRRRQERRPPRWS